MGPGGAVGKGGGKPQKHSNLEAWEAKCQDTASGHASRMVTVPECCGGLVRERLCGQGQDSVLRCVRR